MIELSSYRSRIGCFSQNIKKRGTFKQIHHQKYGAKRKKMFTLEALQAILQLVLIVSLIVCEPSSESSEIWPSLTLSQHSLIQTQPTKILQSSAIITSEDFQLVNRNFLARYTYGNKRQNGIKIVHWNKGSSYLENKMNEIEPIIQQHHPHIFGLSEANLFDHHDQNNVQLPKYTLHPCPTLSNSKLKVSRVVVYTHNSLVVKARPDLMNDNISAIWLEVGLPRKRKILVCNTYREWGHLRGMMKLLTQ